MQQHNRWFAQTYNMEDLFSTSIAVNNRNVDYKVIFDNEKYVFVSQAGEGDLPSFSFRRQHDQWVDQQPLPASIKDQAIDALENYLLRQL